MKTFEQEIRKRLMRITWFLILSAAAILLAFLLKLKSNIGEHVGLSMEILIGGSAGLLITAFYRIRKYRKALKSRDALEGLHIQETDERNCSIALKACSTCLYMTFALLGVAAIVAVLFSRTVFLTIGFILIALLVLYGVFLGYYARKY